MFVSGDPRPILCHTMVMAAYSPVLSSLLRSLNICEGCISYRSIVLVGEDRDTVAELVHLLHSFPSQRVAPNNNKRLTDLMCRLDINPGHVFDSHQMKDESIEELTVRNERTAPFLTHRNSVVHLTRREEPREISTSMDNLGEMPDSTDLEIDGIPITKMKVAELKKALEFRGLTTTGRKKNLIGRLSNHVALNEKNSEMDSGTNKVSRQDFVNPFFSLAASTSRPQFPPSTEAALEKLKEMAKLVSGYKDTVEGASGSMNPQMILGDEGSFNFPSDMSAIEDSNPVSLMSVPSPMLACILAARNHQDTESELEEISGSAVMELLRDSSEEEEDRIAVVREVQESDSTDEETMNPVKQRRMEIKKRRQERNERRARKAAKEAARIPSVGGGRVSKRRRDSSNSGELTAAAAAYEG